jgi:hypothetical protein
VEAVIDVGTQRVQGDATVRVALGPRHLGTAEAAGDLDLDALGAGAHRAGQRALHRAAEGNAILQLLRDRLRNEPRVELGSLDLKNVDLHLLAGDPVQVTPQLIDLRPGLTDDDPWPGCVDVDLHLGGVLTDRDIGQPGVRQAADDVLSDQRVLVQEVGEVPLVEPVRLPIVDVAHADRLGMNFLTHELFLVLRREQDREVTGALANPRRAAHRARPEPLDRRTLVGVHRLDVQVLANELVVVLGVRDR